MFSLVWIGKEWAGLVFLHQDNHLNHLQKVDAFTFQGGERTGRPNFSPPELLTTKHHFCFGLSDKTMGLPSFYTKQILLHIMKKYKGGGGTDWVRKN